MAIDEKVPALPHRETATGHAAFSLLEVLVALAVASLTAAAVAGTTRAVLFARSRSHAELAALWLGEKSLEEMLAWDSTRLAPQTLDDQVIVGAHSFARHRSVAVGPRDDLWLLGVTIHGATAERDVRFDTLRVGEWSPP